MTAAFPLPGYSEPVLHPQRVAIGETTAERVADLERRQRAMSASLSDTEARVQRMKEEAAAATSAPAPTSAPVLYEPTAQELAAVPAYPAPRFGLFDFMLLAGATVGVVLLLKRSGR